MPAVIQAAICPPQSFGQDTSLQVVRLKFIPMGNLSCGSGSHSAPNCPYHDSLTSCCHTMVGRSTGWVAWSTGLFSSGIIGIPILLVHAGKVRCLKSTVVHLTSTIIVTIHALLRVLQITGLAMILELVGMVLLILSLVMLYYHSFGRATSASTVPGFGY